MSAVPSLRSLVVLAGLRYHRPQYVRPLVGLAALALILSVVFSVTQGSVPIPMGAVAGIIAASVPRLGEWLGITPSWPATYEAVVLQIRLPRAVLAGMVGASLAVAGASYQGLFRNPLADPYLIGVASGAGLGAVAAIVLPLPAILYPLGVVQWMAFASGIIIVALVYLLARVGRSTPTFTLLLAGVALGAFATSVTSFLMYTYAEKLHTVYAWLLGGLTMGSWQQVLVTLPYMVLGFVVIIMHSRLINVLQLDEEQAAQLGIDVERLKQVLVMAATLMTAAAVSVSGLIGFVGLIVPHAVRLIWGPDHRLLLPMSALLGAIFLVWADTLARTILAPVELPVGVVTAFCGAPFFLWLLRQRKRTAF
ncbi:MAG: iron chelate uptake ABC transporter family permease subunit [Bacteroidetes bacterium]|nr:iron chelate uptake ABC transporter family permease subunit [Bacteroidota bacterium]MCL5027233.1 iron chelate uptake ABC transporter family permease subunit [Chloroflexota bacterium]